MLLNIAVLTIAAYLLGSLPFGIWIGRLFTGRDIRAGGSGHTGATNVFRQAGLRAGVPVLVLDVAKGYAAGWLASEYGLSPLALPLAAAAATAGHCWPIFARFRGGMGLATAGGALLVVYPLGFVLGIGLVAAGTLILRHSARASVLAGILIGPVVWLFSRSLEATWVALASGLVVALRFMADWRRQYRELWLDRGQAPGDTT